MSPENAVIATGLDGLSKFVRDLENWHKREDRKFMASYLSQCIEKFGSGGGNFRKMYATFLFWAEDLVPDLITDDIVLNAKKSATSWTELSILLETASKEPDTKAIWEQSSEKARQILEAETALFKSLENNLSV